MKENSMSEEKAMKFFYNLRATIDESNMLFDEDLNVKCGKETIKHITTVLNLIEKQQKENEELKIKEFQLHLATEEMKSMIYKQKVKDKIEELNQKIENEENEKVIVWLHKQISVLQDLLEGRK